MTGFFLFCFFFFKREIGCQICINMGSLDVRMYKIKAIFTQYSQLLLQHIKKREFADVVNFKLFIWCVRAFFQF